MKGTNKRGVKLTNSLRKNEKKKGTTSKTKMSEKVCPVAKASARGLCEKMSGVKGPNE